MGIMKIDNFQFIRRKILATLGYGVFQQSISQRNHSGLIVSDILVSSGTSDVLTSLDPFNKKTFWNSQDKIIEDTGLTSSSNWVYLMTLIDHVNALIRTNSIHNFQSDIKPIYPQLDETIYPEILNNPGFVYTNNLFSFKPEQEYGSQHLRNTSLIDQVFSKKNDKISITETTNLMSFEIKGTIPEVTLDIAHVHNIIANIVKFTKSNIIDVYETTVKFGEWPSKCKGLKDMIMPINLSGYNWTLFVQEREGITFLCFVNWNGDINLVYKLGRGNEDSSFQGSLSKCKKISRENIPPLILNVDDLNNKTLQTTNIKFVWNRNSQIVRVIFAQISELIKKMQNLGLYKVLPDHDGNIMLSFPYLVINHKDQKEPNQFHRWFHDSESGYNTVVLVIKNVFSSINFSCSKIKHIHVDYIRRIVKFLCQTIEDSKIIDNIKDLTIEELSIVVGKNKSKPLSEIDPKRYRFNRTPNPELDNTGRGLVFQLSNYSQQCQFIHQGKPILPEAVAKMTEAQKKGMVKVKQLGGDFDYYVK